MSITVYLADLRHNYLGYVSSDAMPLGIGYMGAVMKQQFPNFDIQLFAYPDKLEAALKQKAPDVLMLANYTWNEAVSMFFAKYTRALNNKCLIIAGGPNISLDDERRINFLKQHHYLDLYFLGEGDFFATEILQRYIELNCNRELLLSTEIHSSVYKHNGTYVVTPVLPRNKNLDDIPSPWLTGLMDQFFDGMLVPLFETNRGCPFSCSFCVQGTKWYSKVHHFSLERIREELEYIGKKISTDFPQQKMIRIADPNFGMYNRDVDIAGYIGEIQQKYNYPLLIDATTGKNRAENIIKTMEQVNGALVLYQAVQSLDDEVLENIQRSNIKLDSYKNLQIHVKGRGLKSSSDLILGLPGESLEKHLNSLEKIVNSGTDKLNNFQAMMLKGSELERITTRDKFGFKTKYRLIPKGYGVYFNQLVFDTEEIIVSTNHLSFEEYLTARKYHLIINVFWNYTRFEGFIKLIQKFGYTSWQWLQEIVAIISEKSSEANTLVAQFLSETQSELFDSEEQLSQFYSKTENLKNLSEGTIGDNLIYKFRTLGLFYYWSEVVEVALKATINLTAAHANDPQFHALLIEYAKYVQFEYVFGKSKMEILGSYEAEFFYDANRWKNDGFPKKDLERYKLANPISILFELNENNKKNLMDAFEIWSFNPKSFSMFIRRIHTDWLKREAREGVFSA